MFLLDINVWLALTFQSHVHHVSAKRWLEAHPSQRMFFCRLTQQGFLRLASNPKAFGDEAVTLVVAWQLYDALLADPQFAFAEESPGLETLWRSFTARFDFSPKVWSDAYLAAFAQAGQLKLVTFDHDFHRYATLDVDVLS
jgi:toxin-antitoxin system PIN domain toxin